MKERSPIPEHLQRLVKFTRRKPVGIVDLCNRLDVSPGRLDKWLIEAKMLGLAIQVHHQQIGLRAAEPDDRIIRCDAVPPVVGSRQLLGIASDLHFGSKYCLRAQLADYAGYAYSRGVRKIVVPGDILDGIYKHGIWELSHHGIEEQTRDAIESLPQHRGLDWYFITGNHDRTLTETCGLEVGPFVARKFLEAGRKDLHYVGARSAYLIVNGVKVHLWHPKEKTAYATSYGLQKRVEAYAPGEKPQILATGHWHRFGYVEERGVHALACPAFQGGGSDFGKSLRGSPALGGLILQWELTAHRTIRHFQLERVPYFEREVPQKI